jgi:hypothetical protein
MLSCSEAMLSVRHLVYILIRCLSFRRPIRSGRWLGRFSIWASPDILLPLVSSARRGKAIAMTSAEFFAKAWKLANDKARELWWTV